MEMDAHHVAERVAEQLVFNHLRRHPHQRHGVLVEAALVARHIQRPDSLAVGVQDGHARAGQELVGLQEVVGAVDQRGAVFCQGGANGVGAAALLRPVCARAQRHLVGAREEIVVAQRVQDQAVRVCQDHHALRIHNLVVERLHHRQRVGEQGLAAFDSRLQFALQHGAEVRRFIGAQAIGGGTLVGLRDQFGALGLAGHVARRAGDGRASGLRWDGHVWVSCWKSPAIFARVAVGPHRRRQAGVDSVAP